MKIRTIAVTSLVALGMMLIACKPSSKVPLTGQLSLTYVSSTKAELRLQLANRTTRSIFFRGGGSFFTDIYPWDTKIECWDPQAREWKEAQSGTSHAHSDDIEVSPGEQVFVAVNRERAQNKIGAVQGTRCKLLLFLQDAVTPNVYSNEFEF